MPQPADLARKAPAEAPARQAPASAAAASPAAELLNARPEVQKLAELGERLSARPAGPAPIQRAAPPPRPNRTGLPDRLKAGVEALSGLSMDDVRVHRNSGKPAKLGALAYAQGSDIHLGPGHERHLPHEAWHVVQQKQGRVQPTVQMREGAVNLDADLEHEADRMGTRAAGGCEPSANLATARPASSAVIQGNGWRTLFRRFVGLPRATLARTRVLPSGTVRYRVDTRPPEEIQSSGFFPKVIRIPMEEITVGDIRDYQVSNVYNPGIVSTAETLDGAVTFAQQLGATSPGTKYIYRVDLAGLIEFPQSENIPMLQRIFYSEQDEGMVAGGIDPTRIELEKEISTSAEDAASAGRSGFSD